VVAISHFHTVDDVEKGRPESALQGEKVGQLEDEGCYVSGIVIGRPNR
jgi:hypothetical protein